MASMNRRDFIRSAGIASAATAAACAYDPKTPAEHVLPYVNQDDDVMPGTAAYYATTCTGCASACGMVARAKEGRVVFVEGNPDHPSGPGLCTRGHMVLLEAYSPDRVAGPLNGGTATTWPDALTAIQQAITQARADGKSVAWLGQYRTGSLARLLDEVAAGTGMRRVHWEPLGLESLLAASRATFGRDAVPTYDLSGAHTIVSFGMDFLGTALDSLHMIRGWASARDPQQGGFIGRFVAIEPRVGVTSAQADHFLSPTPGTEAQVALALAKLVHDKKGYSGPATALLEGVNVEDAAKASAISEEKLTEIAGWLVVNPSVVLPGGFANAGTDATALAIATLLINEVAGNIGRSVVYGRELQPGPVHSYSDVKALLEDARAGNVGVLFLDGVNPVYNLPSADNAGEALDKVGTLVQFANEPDDSSRPKTLLLPTGSGLECWGDAAIIAGVHSLQQPASTPLKDTMGVGDILLTLGKALVPAAPAVAPPTDATVLSVDPVAVVPVVAPVVAQAPAFQAADYAAYVKARWERDIYPVSGAADFDAFWVKARQRGGFFQEPLPTGAPLVLAAAPKAGNTPEGTGPVLVVFPSSNLGDGRHANRPWAQELPDPISTYSWSTWAELNPATVKGLGIKSGDRVKVAAAGGEIDVACFASPGVPENVVAVMLGNGHAGMGRYATGRGANPMKLVPSAVDGVSGALATYTTRATISRSTEVTDVLAAVGSMHQDGRPLANTFSVAEAAANPEGEAGSLVHLHQIPVDERLLKKGILDMYPEPQHPTYRFAMAIDTNVCNGCMACVVACNLENNIPFVGPDQVRRGRMMSWIRMDRFWEGEGEHQDVRHLPSLCQHCAHAPCESVCPVLATYHNLDGLNAMIYNRCVGTRYCANNCPYTARRFNYHGWEWPESMHLMLNPDLSTREMGVMEKCTFCVQRLRSAKDQWRDVSGTVPDAALQKLTACAAACPSGAITFGNSQDAEGAVAHKWQNARAYTLFGELNTKPGIRYLARARFSEAAAGGHGGATPAHAPTPAPHEGGEVPAHHKEG